MLLRISFVATLAFLLPAASLDAQESRFRYDANKAQTGIVYQYKKSNIDGSNPANISLYVAAKDRLESLKWHEGSDNATLVIAKMDWKRFSIRRFETWDLRAGSRPERRVVAEYDAEADQLTATLGSTKLTATIQNWPWHSFDFDFASLNFAFRHLVDPQVPFEFGVTDPVRTASGPQLVDKGRVRVEFQRDAIRGDQACREYLIDGPGLENKGGRIWIRKKDGVVVDYEIALPDEPGFTSAKLKLLDTVPMTSAEWSQFKQRSVQ